MRECRAAVVLQRAKHWIGVDLVSHRRQKPAAVVAGEVVSKGDDRATVVEEGSTGSASIQHGIIDLRRPSCPVEDGAAAVAEVAAGGVAAESAVFYRQRVT